MHSSWYYVSRIIALEALLKRCIGVVDANRDASVQTGFPKLLVSRNERSAGGGAAPPRRKKRACTYTFAKEKRDPVTTSPC
ncbi:hypothetical protein EVAR_74866_1 [Eumeta japonica]|uniref:Uncharacterized protein n=1 Tax=Eumeta variegata TaxID=151549 RepID=A0A4C1SQ89_EUMVA|nr:hypothetical protein EVAR_74866_1 [Eumeta japonica]